MLLPTLILVIVTLHPTVCPAPDPDPTTVSSTRPFPSNFSASTSFPSNFTGSSTFSPSNKSSTGRPTTEHVLPPSYDQLPANYFHELTSRECETVRNDPYALLKRASGTCPYGINLCFTTFAKFSRRFELEGAKDTVTEECVQNAAGNTGTTIRYLHIGEVKLPNITSAKSAPFYLEDFVDNPLGRLFYLRTHLASALKLYPAISAQVPIYRSACGMHDSPCKKAWKRAVPAQMSDIVQAIDPNLLVRKLLKEESYAVRMGFLQKPNEALTQPASFLRLRTSVEDESDGLSGVIQKDYVMDLMKDEYKRQLRETTNYDYVEIPKEMAEGGVEIREHRCGEKGDQVVFVDAVRSAQGGPAAMGKPEYDWSEDLAFLDNCCLFPAANSKSWPVKPYSIKALKNSTCWPTSADFTYKATLNIGYFFGNSTLSREQILAAEYKYSMSQAERAKYLVKPAKQSTPTIVNDGNFVAPPKTGLMLAKNHAIKSTFCLPDPALSKREDADDDKIYIQLRPLAVSCYLSDCPGWTKLSVEEQNQLKTGAIDRQMVPLKIYIPRVVGAQVKYEEENAEKVTGKALQRIGHWDLLDTVTVDNKTQAKKEHGSWIAYNPSEWEEDEN